MNCRPINIESFEEFLFVIIQMYFICKCLYFDSLKIANSRSKTLCIQHKTSLPVKQYLMARFLFFLFMVFEDEGLSYKAVRVESKY